MKIKIAKIFAVTLTLSLSFSLGWYTTENYFSKDPEPTYAVMETIRVTHIDTFSVPQTITFYDTVMVPKIHVFRDTVLFQFPLPPRPWKSEGRPD